MSFPLSHEQQIFTIASENQYSLIVIYQ